MKYLICPICGQPLSAIVNGVGCVNRHNFDRAKEGYFNLLPAQHKNSREPGDSKQQLLARRHFLQAGFFSPAMLALTQLIPVDTHSLLDIGCGEGYFTQAMSQHCQFAEIYGVDIAKEGVRMAAKQARGRGTYFVGSSYALPMATSSIAVVTRVYAPSKAEELRRVLTPDGQLIIVTPGEKHLLSLRERIYTALRPHPKPQLPFGFECVSQQRVSFDLDIPAGDNTQALLQMTPFAWQINADMFLSLIAHGLQDTADFQLSVYRVS